jgi:hypothetical protein
VTSPLKPDGDGYTGSTPASNPRGVDRVRFVYIAGPLTNGPSFVNIHLAVKVADRLRRAGLIPFCPHLMSLWETVAPGATYEDWMTQCLAWLGRCDAVLRMPGESAGSDREVAHAAILGIPVFYDEESVVNAGMRKLRPRP